jgi:hypothetical protein
MHTKYGSRLQNKKKKKGFSLKKKRGKKKKGGQITRLCSEIPCQSSQTQQPMHEVKLEATPHD